MDGGGGGGVDFNIDLDQGFSMCSATRLVVFCDLAYWGLGRRALGHLISRSFYVPLGRVLLWSSA